MVKERKQAEVASRTAVIEERAAHVNDTPGSTWVALHT
jgi:hypothetical protein